MREKIKLFNHFHNGDLFYSRMLINILIEKYDIDYHHNQRKPVFNDVDGLTELPLNVGLDEYSSNISGGLINTWVGQNRDCDHTGCSFDNNYKLIDFICSKLNFKVEKTYSVLPTINYDKLSSKNSIDLYFKNIGAKYIKKVLICNGNVLSGQSVNFDINRIVFDLSVANPNVIFFITDNKIKNENIIYTGDLTNVSPDLLEISYISNFCDIIVGRTSGPYCFTQTKENLMSKDKTFIAFCNNVHEGKFYEDMVANFVWSNNYDLNNIFNIINGEINK